MVCVLLLYLFVDIDVLGKDGGLEEMTKSFLFRHVVHCGWFPKQMLLLTQSSLKKYTITLHCLSLDKYDTKVSNTYGQTHISTIVHVLPFLMLKYKNLLTV